MPPNGLLYNFMNGLWIRALVLDPRPVFLDMSVDGETIQGGGVKCVSVCPDSLSSSVS